MFNYSTEELERLGAVNTTREIRQQPKLWREVLETIESKRETIETFLNNIKEKHDSVKVIFTGAGTSAYVGETLLPQIMKTQEDLSWEYLDVATTDLVTNPTVYFKETQPTLLVSYARSGNSPESVATVKLAQQLVSDLYQITITCSKEGQLAKNSHGDDKNLLLLQPELSNDLGFAMTGAFSCMYLTSLLIFDNRSFEQKKAWVEQMIETTEGIFDKEEQIQALVDLNVERVVYLGSGVYFGLAHETQLKILELTAGAKTTLYETVLGFRHGPKSIVNDQTAIILYQSEDAYARQYELDLMAEIAADKIAKSMIVVGGDNPQIDGFTHFDIALTEHVEEGYLVLPYVVFGQIYALLSSIAVDNTPDTPSKTGTVNRVVKGVTIHPFEK